MSRKVYGYKTVKSNYGINSFLNDMKKNNLKILEMEKIIAHILIFMI